MNLRYISLIKSFSTLAFLTLFGLNQLLAAEKTSPKDKETILITGANRGLGLELAKQFLADGYNVYGTARKPEEAQELKSTGAQVLQLDVTSQESINNLAKEIEGKPLDILVNNAGYFGPNKIGTKMDGITKLSRSEIENCFSVNTMGPVFVTQALLPNLNAGKQKKIINISTRASIISKSGGKAYGYKISKAALNMLTNVLHGELNNKGYIIVSIAPGHNQTDMGTNRAKMTPAKTMPLVKKLIQELTPDKSGRFWYYTGKELPW